MRRRKRKERRGRKAYIRVKADHETGSRKRSKLQVVRLEVEQNEGLGEILVLFYCLGNYEQGASAFDAVQLQRLSSSEFLRFLPPISQHQLVKDLSPVSFISSATTKSECQCCGACAFVLSENRIKENQIWVFPILNDTE